MKSIIATISLLALMHGVFGQATWTSIGSGNWSDASKWALSGGAVGAPPTTLTGNQVVLITGGFTINQASQNLLFEGSSVLRIENAGTLMLASGRTLTVKDVGNSFIMNGGTLNSSGSGGNILIEKGNVNWQNSYLNISGNLTIKKDISQYVNINVCVNVAQNILFEGIGKSGNPAIMTDAFYVSGTSGTGNLTFSSNSIVSVSNVKLNGSANTSNVEFFLTQMNGSLYSVRAGQKITVSNMTGITSLLYYCAPTLDPNLNYFSGLKINNCTIANQTCSGIPIPDEADLQVIKTASPETVLAGQQITYTITVSNNGPSVANSVVVNDVLNSALTLQSFTVTVGNWNAPNWNVGNLNNGSSATMTITATVSASYTGSLSNTATVSSSTFDPVSNNNSSTALVNVQAIIPPTANDDNATTPMNTPVNINVLANDVAGSSPINPASVTFVAGTAPNPITQGTFTVNATTGLVTFTPVNGFTGTVTIDYQVCDQNALCDVATITVIVSSVAGPTAIDDNATTPVNTPVNINILQNDVAGDAALNPSSVTFINGTQPNPTTEGIFSVNSVTGLVTFSPANNYTGTVTIDYQVCDLNGLCDIATITVVITPTVVGPTANDDNATTPINTPVNINVLANDVAGSSPINPASVTFVAGTAPNPTTQGTFTVNGTTGLVTFTPVNGFTGTVTIDYQVCDLNGLCDIATITVVITPAVVGPTANDDSATTLVNTPVDITVLSNDVAGSATLDPTTVSFIAGTEPNPSTQGTFTVNQLTGLVTFTPVNGFTGTVTIDYQVCDLNGLCDIATITVNIILGTGNLYPALGPGTLAFEDLWPGKGDYDFNDLVIDYQFEIISNISNYVEKVTATFVIRAFGASFENGFGFQLSGAVNAADLTVTGFDLTENFINLAANGTEAGQSKPTIIVFDNAFAQMPHPGIGIGVNTEPSAPYVQPVTITVNIDFKPNTYTINQLDISNFNPFLIVNKNRSHEVHLPNYPPTDLVDMSLFGQWEDASNPATGRWYVNDKNLPWAINIYESFAYPIEKQEILWAHLKFAEWAMSGGVQFPDWYKNLTGYRNSSLIYQVPSK